MLDVLRLISQWSVPTFIVSSMLAAGLGLRPRAVLGALARPRLVTGALVINFVVAPAVGYAITRLFHLQPAHAVGLLLLACAAGAPFAPKLAEAAREDVPLAVALMALFTVGTIVVMPLALPLLTPGFSVSAGAIVRALVPVMVIPLVVGTIVGARAPRSAATVLPFVRAIASVSLVMLLVLVIGLNTPALWSVVGSGAFAASLVFIAVVFAIGYVSGGARRELRAGLGLATAARNVGAAVPVAAAGHNPEVMVMILVATVGELVVCVGAVAWIRRGKGGTPEGGPSTEPAVGAVERGAGVATHRQ
ncbi:MAG: bile acid:sodium symporter family protein [Phycisphaerae bacterium]|nr:bile acid:sodium symporter [Tepidisphaeraceae bacterium]